jgi:hypothetical protein
MTAADRDRIRELATALRGCFAAERAAIAKLDGSALGELAAAKQQLGDRLAAAVADAARTATEPDPELRELLSAVRIEARATALLAGAAAGGVRALLGTKSDAYDRRAKHAMPLGSSRTLGVF